MFTLESGSGFWNPLIWIFIIFISFLLFYGIRGFGKSIYKRGTEQTKSFLSGNKEGTQEEIRVKAGNLYWGFATSMKVLYNGLRKMHTGITSDYLLWFIIILAILFLIIGVI